MQFDRYVFGRVGWIGDSMKLAIGIIVVDIMFMRDDGTAIAIDRIIGDKILAITLCCHQNRHGADPILAINNALFCNE